MSRDGETVTLMELRQASALASGQHPKAPDHGLGFKRGSNINQPDREMTSERSRSPKGDDYKASASRSARNTAAHVGIAEAKEATQGQKTKNVNE